MTMKRTELEKRMALAIVNAQRRSDKRFRPAAADRKAQRAADRAAGRVPFAVKLPAELVAQLRARAEQAEMSVEEVVAVLLKAGLSAAAASDDCR